MWQFILTDLSGNVHGEVTQAANRKVTLPHLRVPAASFTIPTYHPLATTVLDSDCLLRAYRTDEETNTKSLAFHGPVVSAEETADGSTQTVAVTAAGPYWRMSKRIIPGSKLQTGIQYGDENTLADLGLIARAILSDVNAAGYTGIGLGDHLPSTSAWAGKWYLKNAAEAIAELAAGLNSFEYRVRPTEPTASGFDWPQIGLLDIEPIIGDERPDAIFEYGTRRANVGSYGRRVSREGILNRAICSVSGWPDSVEKVDTDPDPLVTTLVDKYSLVEVSDATSIAAGGLFEEVVSDAGVLDDGLRTSIADFHVAIRKNPRQILTFKPAVNARPAPFVDYGVGDTVRARAEVNGTIRFDALFRIWGVTFDVDQNGNETVELELVMP